MLAYRIAPILVCCVVTSAAQADVTLAYYDGQTLGYKITHMPDLDQRRMACEGVLGLANNGSMFCVPTSAMNICGYAATHGFPQMDPGNVNYGAAANYTLGTLNIAFLAANMQTSPTDGTSGGPAFDGLKDWVTSSGLAGKLNVHNYYLNSNYAPSAKKMGLMALNGHLVSFAYGRWEPIGFYGNLPLVDRTGGHAVTLSRSSLVNDIGMIECRDPADVRTDCVQLPFTSRELTVTPIAVAYCNTGPECNRQLSALNYPSEDGNYRFIDGYLTLSPKTGYSWTTGGFDTFMYVPYPTGPLFPFEGPEFTEIDGIGGIVMDADETGFYAIGQDAPILGHYDLFTGDFTHIADLNATNAIAMGPDLELYVLENDQIICINPIADDPFIEFAPLPTPPGPMIWTGNGTIRVFSPDEHVFMDYPVGLNGGAEPDLIFLPGEIPMFGKAAMARNPADNSTWFLTEESPLLFGFPESIGPEGIQYETVEVPGMTAPPTCVSFDDAGRMFVVSGGEIFEMVRDADGNWIPAADREFEGVEVGDKFMVTCSRTNYDPEVHSGPKWNNIEPEELDQSGEVVEDCIADLNGDGTVGIEDLLELLASWGETVGFDVADFDPPGGDGEVGVNDLLKMLSLWGDC